MLYIVCPTCGRLLGNIQIIYETEMTKICDLDIEESKKEDMKELLVNSLNLKRYCCRQRLLTFIPLVKIIK